MCLVYSPPVVSAKAEAKRAAVPKRMVERILAVVAGVMMLCGMNWLVRIADGC